MNKPFSRVRQISEAPYAEPIQTELVALEERIMFDGAAAAEVADAAADAVALEAAEAVDPKADADALVAAAGEMPQTARNEIFFVDAAIEDPAGLISELPSGAEVVLLDADQDGVAQMASVLEGRTDLDAIHILAHGEEGQLALGNSVLNAGSIVGTCSESLTVIGEALSSDGDILIYGCDFSSGEAGIEATAMLAEMTGADIAASDDLTGHADLGGDWLLETKVGQIETLEVVAEGWDGVLAPPEVTVPASALAAAEDTDLVISEVSVADADGDNLEVSLDVSNGTITLAQTTSLTVSGDGTASVTLNGSAVDINNALSGMIYRADSNYNGSDTFAIAANDGDTIASESVGVQVTSVNDAPTLTPTNPSVDEGGTATLTEANFGVDDPDLDMALNTTPQLAKQLVFKLDPGNLPDEGNLLLNGAPLLGGSTFSLQDVRDGNLTYRHGGADVSAGDTDNFAVTINDGGGSGDVGPIPIIIDLQPVNQGPSIGGSPSVFEGQGTEDEFADPGTVTETADIGGSLSISDRDDTLADSQITITNIDNASEGTLLWDADGDGQLGAGEALNGGETFAADELAAGRLRFAHDGDEVDGTNPSFDIEVTDAGGGAGSGNAQSSGPQTIEIAVNPNNDNPELTTNNPVAVLAGIQETVQILDSDLQVTDDDTGNSSIVYVVTAVPTKGELRIDGEVLGVGGSFTQADIVAGRIDYNSTSAFVDGETDTFQFEVRDSTLRAYNNPGLEGADRNPDGTVTEHTFTINLTGNRVAGLPPDGAAPGRSGSVEIATSTIGSVTVTEEDAARGGVDTIVIRSSELEFNLQTVDADEDTLAVAADQTVYRITSAPGNGTLYLSGVALGNYGTFTQQDIDDGLLEFVHDGSENHQDEFGFNVTGGTGSDFDGTFELFANPTNDAPSVGTSDLPLMPEGATTRVTSSHISLGDVDANNEPGEGGGANDPNVEAIADDLMFRVTDLPDNGTLERFDGTNWVTVDPDDLLPSDLLTTSADGEVSGLRYTHDGSENHTDSFSVQVRDDLTSPGTFGFLDQNNVGSAAAGNLSGTGTVNVTLAPQNDPAISPENEAGPDSTVIDEDGNSQTTANVPLYLPEGGNSVVDSSLLRSVDTDNTDPETLQYRLTQAPAFGTLTLSGNRLGVGSTFTQEHIDIGRLNYEHDGSENFADDFKFIVSDSVSDHEYSPGGPGGASTFNIFVDSARNDLPEVATGGDSTIDLFGTGIFSHNFGSDLAIADVDIDDGNVDGSVGETDFIQVTVTLKDSSGSNVDLSSSGGIRLGSDAGLTQTDDDDTDGDLVFQGAFADVQAALTDLEVELPNQDFNDTFTLEVTVDDRLRDASGNLNLTGGANGGTTNEDGTEINDSNNRDAVTITFRASEVNDDPTITSAPGDQTVNEDAVLNLSGYGIDDPDAFDSPLTVDLAVSNGHLSVTGNANTSDPSSLTLTGTLSEINAALDNLTYIANQDFHSPDGLVNSDDDTLTFTLNDGGSNGAGGGNDVIGPSVDIAINPVNDAPTVGVPGTQTLASGTFITFSGPDAPTVGDARDENNTPFNDFQRVTISVPTGAGTLTGSGTSGLTDLNGSGETLVFEGTLAQLNGELDGLRFTPTDPNADVTVPITVELNDQENGGTALTDGVGGALTASGIFNVQISNINDGPTVTSPSNQTVDEDDSLTFSSGNLNAFTVSDPDDFGTVMEAIVSVDHGVVTAASGSGATLSGDGTATLTITGTESEINAALDGLVYTPDGDFHTSGVAGDTITVTIDDQNNTGTGGDQSDSRSAQIDVDPVNDRPIASGGPQTVTVTGEHQTGAGNTLASLLMSGNYDDTTDNQTTDGGDTSTALSFVAITDSTDYDTAQGTWQVSDGSGGWIEVPDSGLDANNALVFDASREIRFNPAADFHGTPGTLEVRLADGDPIDAISESTGDGDFKNLADEGGTGETGRWSADTVTLNTSVTNENDPPSGSDDATLAAIDEDDTASLGETVGNLFSPVFEDATDDQTGITGGADASTPLGGIAIIGSAADAANEGTWRYSTDGGSNWIPILQGGNSDIDSILLPNDALLRFVPVSDFNGTPGALSVRLADATQGFSASADISGVVGDDYTRDTDIWSTPVDLNTSITPRNDAPILGGTGTSATVDESTSPNDGTDPEQLVTGASVSDLDIGTTSAVSQFGAGTITVSMVDGQSFDQLTITDGSLAGIASVSGGSNGSDLVVELESTATTAQVAAIVEALRYNSSSDTFDDTRDISITLSDGNNDNGSGNNAGGPDALTDTLSASIAINEQNDPPDASDNTVTTNEDTTYEFSAADFNYIQPGGETDVMDGVRIDTLPGIGTLELNGTAIRQYDIIAQSDIVAGNLTYVPPADENGADFKSFTFSVRDDRGAFDATLNTLTVNVLPVNDAPSASPSQNFTIGEDDGTQSVVGFMQSIDQGGGPDEDSQIVTFNVEDVTDGTNFTATELFESLPAFTDATDGDNTIEFTASDILAEGESETVTVTVGMTDDGGTANGGVDTGTDQTFTITITGANDDPVANPDAETTLEDTPVSGTVLSNDSDVDDSDRPTVTGATVDVDGDGIADPLPLGTPTALSATGGDPIGTLTLGTDGAFTFTPAPNYDGPVPQVSYTIGDGNGGTSSSTLDITITPVNDDFTDADEVIAVDEDSGVNTGNLIDGSSVDGPLSVTTFQVAGDATIYNAGDTATITGVGTLEILADGTYNFTPAANYNGPVPVVTYTLTDGSGTDDTSTLTITVDPVNDDFTDADEVIAVDEDSGVNTGNLIDGSSVDGPLSVTTFQVAGDATIYNAGDTATITGVGTLEILADGTYNFTPAANYNGPVPVVTYTLTDGSGTDDTSTLTITVDPVNDDFTDADEVIAVDEDSGVNTGNLIDGSSVDGPLSVTTFQVAGDATIYNAGDTATITGVGTLEILADGTYNFTPAANYNGPVPVVTYTLTDGSGTDDTSTLTITVDPVNDDFTDADEVIAVDEDSGVNTGNLIDGSSVDGPLSVTTFQVAGDATIYNAGDTATITGVGTLEILADGTYNFTPAANYNGPVPVVTYTLTDGSGTDDTSTLTITVDPVNDDFTDADEVIAVDEDSGVNTGNLIDGSSVDGPLSVTTFQVAGDATIYNAGDTATITGVGTLEILADGTYNFTPAANYNGPVPVVTYTLTDGSGTDDTSTLTITVDPVNDDFTDADEVIAVDEDSGVNTGNLIDGSSVDGPLSVTTFQVAGDATIYNAGDTATITGVGTLEILADGTYNFTPAANYNGPVPVVTYTLTDGSGTDDTSTLTITVDPVNDDFTDADEVIAVDEDSGVNTGNLIDGSSVDGPLSVTTFQVAGDATIYNAGDTATITGVGTLEILADGTYNFTPAANYNGPVPVVTYTLTDGSGTDDTSTLTITVDPVNDDFTDADEVIAVDEDSGVNTGNLIDGSSVDGPLSVTTFQVAGDATIYNAGDTATITGVGTLEILADGTYNFTPAANYNGPVPVVTYTLTDGSGTDDTSTLTITVDPVNDDFTDADEVIAVDEDSGVNTGNLIDGSSVDGPLSVTTFQVAGDATIYNAGDTATITGVGTLEILADGTYNFTPAANYNGPVPVVTYTLTDGSGTDDTSTLTITVDPVNDDFTDADEVIAVDEDSGVNTGNLIDGSSVDGPLSVTTFQVAGDATIYNAGDTATITGVGTLEILADGTYNFTPAANYNGPVPVVTYTLTDGSGTDDTSTLTITVDPVNDDFTDADEVIAVDEDSGVNTGNLIDGSSVDGPLSVTTFQVAGDATIYNAGDTATITGVGTLEILADGTYNFTPAANYNGPVPVVTYTLTDGSGTDDTSTLTITVDPVNDDFTDADEVIAVDEDSGVNTGNLIDGSSVDGPLSVTTFQVAGDVTIYNAGDTATITGVGTLEILADGTYNFTPAANYNGPVPVVTYTLTDGSGTDDTSTLTITVDPVNDPPVANPDVVTTLEGAPVSGNLLTNDTDTDGGTLTVIAASVDTDGDGTPDALSFGVATVLTNAAGEPIGTLTLGTDGAFTFVPAAGYDGPVPQVTYTISDGNGGTASSTLDITLTPVEDTTNTDDVNSGVPFDPIDREERVRPRIAVDHIVGETANAANDLFGTPALLSDVYTSLGVRHPILTALNALQSLDGTAELSTRGPEVFSGLAADGPVTQAVRSIGFDPIDDQYRLFNRDFPDGFQTAHADGFGEPAFGDAPSSLVTIQTRLGPVASFELAETAGSPEVLVSISGGAGERLAILAVDAESLGDSRAVISDDGYGLRLSGLESGERIQFAVQLETGTWLAFELQHQDSDDRGERDTLVVTEQSAKTFTANTERLGYAGDIETTKLMQALR